MVPPVKCRSSDSYASGFVLIPVHHRLGREASPVSLCATTISCLALQDWRLSQLLFPHEGEVVQIVFVPQASCVPHRCFLVCIPLSHQDDPIVIGWQSDLPREIRRNVPRDGTRVVWGHAPLPPASLGPAKRSKHHRGGPTSSRRRLTLSPYKRGNYCLLTTYNY